MFSFPKAVWESEPFPHAVVRGAWGQYTIRGAKNGLENIKWTGEKVDAGNTAHKKWCSRIEDMWGGIWGQALVQFMHEADFIAWLEQLSGIKGLIPDHTLKGGGIHRISRGGFLKMHTDFNYHEQLKLYRRLNLLLYLNEGWDPEWGGDLELVDFSSSVSTYRKKIAPEANTMVVFETSERSWHGHPYALECPEGVYRDSIALYYYTAEPPPGFTGKRMSTNYG